MQEQQDPSSILCPLLNIMYIGLLVSYFTYAKKKYLCIFGKSTCIILLEVLHNKMEPALYRQINPANKSY